MRKASILFLLPLAVAITYLVKTELNSRSISMPNYGEFAIPACNGDDIHVNTTDSITGAPAWADRLPILDVESVDKNAGDFHYTLFPVKDVGHYAACLNLFPEVLASRKRFIVIARGQVANVEHSTKIGMIQDGKFIRD